MQTNLESVKQTNQRVPNLYFGRIYTIQLGNLTTKKNRVSNKPALDRVSAH